MFQKGKCHIFSRDLEFMSLFFAYTAFKYSNIDKLHIAAGQINVSMEWKIKAWACQARRIMNIWVERLGGGIELSRVHPSFSTASGITGDLEECYRHV